MIVFYGRVDDDPLVRAIEVAADRGVEHMVVDQARCAEDDELLVRIDPGSGLDGRLRACGAELDLGVIAAVYARPLAPPTPRDPAAARRAALFHATFMEWLDDVSGTLVVSRPRAMASNGSKPYQQQLVAAAAGLAVPETLVTNRPAAARAFLERHGRVVYKSVSGIRSIVRELDAEALERIDRIRLLPTQFQAHVPGVDVRVHVVGEAVLATEIDSAATDYRYADEAELRQVDLPEDVADRCRTLSAALDLPFCGIDLRRRPDGEHVCFEVNPMPGFSYFEARSGTPIAAALIDLLTGTHDADTVTSWSRSART